MDLGNTASASKSLLLQDDTNTAPALNSCAHGCVNCGFTHKINSESGGEGIPTEEDEQTAKEEKRALCISMATLILSIPALLGA